MSSSPVEIERDARRWPASKGFTQQPMEEAEQELSGDTEQLPDEEA